MKASTRSFIGMLDTHWISDLLHNQNWVDTILHVLTAFFLIYDPTANLDLNNKEALRKYFEDKLNKMQNDIGKD